MTLTNHYSNGPDDTGDKSASRDAANLGTASRAHDDVGEVSYGHDADEWGQYRSLSTLAVVAFVLGIASSLAFASPLMLVAPLAAVATALLALKGIAASDGGLSGSRLAYIGLALAVLFGVGSVARIQIRDMLLQSQADRVGQQWLSLASEGRSEEMLPLMSKAAVDKLSPTDPAQGAPSFFGGMFATALMRQDPVVVKLSALQATGDFHLRLKDASIVANSNPPQAVFRYGAGSADSEQQDCLMVLKRFQASGQTASWLVDSWQLE